MVYDLYCKFSDEYRPVKEFLKICHYLINKQGSFVTGVLSAASAGGIGVKATGIIASHHTLHTCKFSTSDLLHFLR